MNDKQQKPRSEPAPGMSLGDVYFVLFRHKWKILFCSLAGVLAAAAIYLLAPSPYQSEAKLFVRYVLEAKMPSGMGGDSQIKQPDTRGETIINSEVEILTSLDLAGEVADAVGVEKILAKAGGGNDRNRAAVLVKRNLKIEVPRNSSILRIAFQHPDPQVVQPVLTQLITSYLKKHIEIHRAVGAFDDLLSQQTDTLRSRLAQTEDELLKTKIKAGVMSLEDAKKAYTEEVSRIRQELFEAEAELAAEQATLNEMGKVMPATTGATTTNLNVPAEKVEEYKSLAARLENFRRMERELLTQFTEESQRVRDVREQMATTGNLLKKLEQDHPQLIGLEVPPPGSGKQPLDWFVERSQGFATGAARIMALQAKTNILSSQLKEVLARVGTLNELEGPITLLQRKKDLEENQYRYFSSSLEQARFDDALGAGKVSNISVVESPSPPFKDSDKLYKVLVLLAIGGVVAGIILAFFIERFLDRTLKRPVEVETRLRLPLLLSIPDSFWNGRFRSSSKPGGKEQPRLKAPEPETAAGKTTVPAKTRRTEVAPWESTHALRPFYEALRDRLVTDFEARNLTHKPKLVAVTGCARGSGVTSIAAGLAATLSETGDGNVLLVDMNLEHGAAHPFYKGKPTCGLDEILEENKKDMALVHEKLYLATERSASDKLPRILPKRFTSLVPKLKASDYDYIIFDMPPVSQTSVTPRLAGFMDMMLLVIEAEKTDREVARRANALLQGSKANVSIVLNKTRIYVPPRLHQEFLENV